MLISLFANDKSPQATRSICTWKDLVKSLSTPSPQDVPKNLLPMWSPALFQGDYRAIANVLYISLLVFDVDEHPIPSLEVMESLLKGVRWFAHSSSSSLETAQRWRLILDLSRPLTVEEHSQIWKYFAEKLPFPVGAASKDASRAWYCPRRGDDGSFFFKGSE